MKKDYRRLKESNSDRNKSKCLRGLQVSPQREG